MTIVHEPEKHRFAAYGDAGGEIGHLEYSPHGNVLSAVHTWTDEAHRGRGVAGALLAELVRHAESNRLSIIPVCSYVKAAFEKDTERFAKVRFKKPAQSPSE